MAKIEISGELFRQMCTKGYKIGAIECVEGIPEGAILGKISIKPYGEGHIFVLEVEHPDLEDKVVNVVFKRTYFEPYSAYKVREMETGFFITKSGTPKTRGELMDWATARTVADYLGEGKAELVEYKLVEVKKYEFRTISRRDC